MKEMNMVSKIDGKELDFYLRKGKEFLMSKNYLSAIENLKKAISLNPSLDEAYIYLGDALVSISKYESALKAYSIAMELNPSYHELYYKIGLVLYYLNKCSEAEPYLMRYIAVNKKFEDAYNCLYLVYRNLNDLNKAEYILRKGINEVQESAKLHNNLANVLQWQGRFDEAMEEYNIALKLCKDFPEAEVGRSLIYLLRGNFKKGWDGYESRLDLPFFKNSINKFAKPMWDGRPLIGKALLIWTEQGYGDAIQFIRFVEMVRREQGKVIVCCQRALIRLFEHIEGIDDIYDKNIEKDLEYDFHLPIMSLGKFFVKDESSIPNSVPYINIPLEDINRIKGEIGFSDRFLNIGVVWGGNVKYKNDKNRSINLKYFMNLFDIDKIKLYSLQKGEYVNQLSSIEDEKIVNLDKYINDFYDTALMIENLDLVISVDTAVAHLAGALGKNVWLLIPKYPDWRWMLDRRDSPWYPTMRIFRQKKENIWDDVFYEIGKELINSRVNKNGDRML